MKVSPAVPIKLDRKRSLLLNLNAMVAFEKETGKNLFDDKVLQAFATVCSPVDLRALLWACLLHEDESLAIEEVGTWLFSGNMMEAASKVVIAFVAAMPEGGKKKKRPFLQRLLRRRRSG